MGDKNSVLYMTTYLKYALEFEKNVYIWTKAMGAANEQMQQLYAKRNEEMNNKQRIHFMLESVDVSNSHKRIELENKIRNLAILKNVVLIISVLVLLLIFVVGSIFGYLNQNNIQDAIFYGVAMVFYGVFTGIIPAFLIAYLVCLSKYQNEKRNFKKLPNEYDLNNHKNNLREREIEIELNLAELNVDEENIVEKQEEIMTALNQARSTLRNIYDVNVLPNRYRCFSAVATLYEYLSTGRCNTIQGHGGIYDTFETERIQIEQLNQLIIMNQTLKRIEDYQRCIYIEMQKANQTLTEIKYTLESIGDSLDAIKTNSSISAYANQQSVASLSWLSWNEWHKN